MTEKYTDGNVTWLRERADGIRRGDCPSKDSEWDAFAKGLDMVADAYVLVGAMALQAAVALDVLTDPSKNERIEH